MLIQGSAVFVCFLLGAHACPTPLSLDCGLPLLPPLSDCGPPPTPTAILPAPSLVLPGAPTPIIELPSPPLPPEQVIDHQCFCTKTIVKPQLFQRLLTVPSLSRFLKQTLTPVVQQINYNCGSCGLPPLTTPLFQATSLPLVTSPLDCGLSLFRSPLCQCSQNLPISSLSYGLANVLPL